MDLILQHLDIDPGELANVRFHVGPATLPPGVSFDPRLAALIAQNKRIEAIKLYRQRTGVSLKEAKDTIDALQRGMRQ